MVWGGAWRREASEQAREAREKEAAVKEALRQTAPLRADLEGRMRMGLRTGDAEMMREAIKELRMRFSRTFRLCRLRQ